MVHRGVKCSVLREKKDSKDWDVKLMEELGINVSCHTFDPDWMVTWNRTPIFQHFSVQSGISG